jgi:putative FmdB family regulatory protein
MECNYSFEEFQKINDEPLKICPECQGRLKRMIGPGVTPIFKGSGFYQTDYKSNAKTNKETEVTKTDKKSDDVKNDKKKYGKNNTDKN